MVRYVGDGRGSVRKGGAKPITKPGRHGTLYLYRVEYRGTPPDPCEPPLHTTVWAYSEESALENVDCDVEGWEATTASRLYE